MSKKIRTSSIIASMLFLAALAVFDFREPVWFSNRGAFIGFGLAFLLFAIDIYRANKRSGAK